MKQSKSKKMVIFMLIGLLAGISYIIPVNCENLSDAKLIKIMPLLKENKITGFYLSPQVMDVKKDTIVVWLNGAPNEIQVVFSEGKTCRDVTINPHVKQPGFFLDAKSCYTTSFLPYGATTTLQFVELGSYDYEVTTEDGKITTKGKIIVRP